MTKRGAALLLHKTATPLLLSLFFSAPVTSVVCRHQRQRDTELARGLIRSGNCDRSLCLSASGAHASRVTRGGAGASVLPTASLKFDSEQADSIVLRLNLTTELHTGTNEYVERVAVIDRTKQRGPELDGGHRRHGLGSFLLSRFTPHLMQGPCQNCAADDKTAMAPAPRSQLGLGAQEWGYNRAACAAPIPKETI